MWSFHVCRYHFILVSMDRASTYVVAISLFNVSYIDMNHNSVFMLSCTLPQSRNFQPCSVRSLTVFP